jgi:hypothetical protein
MWRYTTEAAEGVGEFIFKVGKDCSPACRDIFLAALILFLPSVTI